MRKNHLEWRWKNAEDDARLSRGIPKPKHHIDPNMDWELCTDLDNEFFDSAWAKFKGYNMEGRVLTDYLKSHYNLKKCKKTEATALLFIGIKNDSGLYQKGVIHYWLCSIK
jgi:hypothetical protein